MNLKDALQHDRLKQFAAPNAIWRMVVWIAAISGICIAIFLVGARLDTLSIGVIRSLFLAGAAASGIIAIALIRLEL
jgi:hypothetical protein